MSPCGIEALVGGNQCTELRSQVGGVFDFHIGHQLTVQIQVIDVIHGVHPYHVPLGICFFRFDSRHGFGTIAHHDLNVIPGLLLKQVRNHRVKVV